MAEIFPDDPPAQPKEVQVFPDDPPREPFPVNISLDAPPAEPFSVPIYPDAPPREPFPVDIRVDDPPRGPVLVQITLDDPPREPVQVPVYPDGPPAQPFDVPIYFDAPPAQPFDVSIYPDDGPRDPIPVEVLEDLPPREPVPIDVVLSPAPREPIPVEVTLDRPPSAPIAVEVTLSAPPRDPIPVDIFPDVPALDLSSTSGGTPTIQQIINAVSDFDRRLGSFLGFIVESDPVSFSTTGAGALDPSALARWFSDYRTSVGDSGIAKFIAEQSALYALNPVVARIFDPTYFLKMLSPGSMGHVTTTADVEIGVTMQTVAQARDAELQLAVASNPLRPGGDGRSDRPDVYGPENTSLDGQDFTVDAMVDAALPGEAFEPGGSQFLRSVDGIKRFDANAYFESRDSSGASRTKAAAKALAASSTVNAFRTKLAQSNALDGIIRVGVPGEEGDGVVLSSTHDPSIVVDDDDTRVPVSFTDLRKDPVRNAYRTVYFRALNLEFNTSIAPEYSEASSFGRVDPMVGYQKTVRTHNVSFEVQAFAPEDLERMYNKMTWLSSMCYPSYGSDALLRSGPVIRLRIGDVIATELGGVPGVIRSLDFNFDGALWELKRGMKVPRSYKVSVGFLALHDAPIGLLNGVFGGLSLPSAGGDAQGDRNFAGNPTQSQNVDPQRATVVPGRFMRFGEPRK